MWKVVSTHELQFLFVSFKEDGNLRTREQQGQGGTSRWLREACAACEGTEETGVYACISKYTPRYSCA